MTDANRNTTDSLDSAKDLVERRMVKTVALEADQLTGIEGAGYQTREEKRWRKTNGCQTSN
jgi:hypothetical protein